MLELFLNPANMVVGGLLVGSPILIHLINRLRFRRVRWAAMEFLLRAQKRNRRRLIIEQLLLLLLRILLVLMAGLLLARFLGLSWAGFQAKNSLHLVILDDRLSMSDHWRGDDGEDRDCFSVGARLVERELAKVLAQGRTAQRLVFLRLSDPDHPFERRLSEEAVRELSSELARSPHGTDLHLDWTRGIDAARDILDKNAQDNRYLHLVSDFRQRHWSGPGAEGPLKKLDSLARAGVKIHLVDTAHPFRSESGGAPLYHDNLAIVDVRPETQVAAEGMPVQFTVTIANFSASERRNVRVSVKVNGVERLEASVPFKSVPPGHTSGVFQAAFTQIGFNDVTANLEDEEAGLLADNVAYALVEVRRQVPVLLIDGDLTSGDKPGGDSFHMRALLTSAKGYEVTRAGPTELERPNLNRYPAIYLLNVRELSDKALSHLEAYARDGGGVAFFLGDRVRPDFYNARLYAAGKGLFPAPLADRPTPALSEEERQERQLQSLAEPHYQAFVRRPDHPVFTEVYPYRDYLKYLSVDRYWPVPRRTWHPEPGRVEELLTLPNDRPISDYQAAAQELLDAIPSSNPAYAKYRAALEERAAAVRDALSRRSLYQLAAALGAFLESGDRPILGEFWKLTDPSVQSLRRRIEGLRDLTQFGDPLVIASQYGRGRVIAFLTSAGRSWNDWAGGGLASPTYPVVMLDLQKYLAGGAAEEGRTVGTPAEIQVDAGRYEGKVHAYFRQTTAPSSNRVDLGEQLGVVSGNRILFTFDKTSRPGVYEFELTPRTDAGGEAKKEVRALAYNVDTADESDLRRTTREELERVGRISTPAAGSFTDLIVRPKDLSESPWFYLVFLALLVAEQALAVHLSFHIKGGEAALPAAASRPAAA